MERSQKALNLRNWVDGTELGLCAWCVCLVCVLGVLLWYGCLVCVMGGFTRRFGIVVFFGLGHR